MTGNLIIKEGSNNKNPSNESDELLDHVTQRNPFTSDYIR